MTDHHVTVESFGRTWAAERMARGVASADVEAAMLRHHLFPQLGAVPITAVTKTTMIEWVRSLPTRKRVDADEVLAPRTVNHIANTVKRMFDEAVDRDVIAGTPCAWRPKRDLPPRQDKDPARRGAANFSAAEVWCLTHDPRIPQDRRVMYALDFLTGMRPGEVAARRWRDLDTSTAPLWLLRVGTQFNSRSYSERRSLTNVEKIVPVHPLLAEALRAWFQGGWEAFMGRAPTPDDLVVPREQGGQRTNTHSNKRFKADMERLGLRGGRTHGDTRATFWSLARAGGASPEDIGLITRTGGAIHREGNTRLEAVWPVLCRVVMAVQPIAPLGVSV